MALNWSYRLYLDYMDEVDANIYIYYPKLDGCVAKAEVCS